MFLFITLSFIALFFFLMGIRIVRPTERGTVETLGHYSRFVNPGFTWVFPMLQRLFQVNVTEQMTDIEPQEIITEDNLNAKVDLVVYYQVKNDEESVKKSLYAVNDFESQIITLSRTTARNVIGGMKFADVNSKRKDLNSSLRDVLSEQTEKWGVEVVRVELKEITPPEDVQETMNQVIQAENKKRAAIDFATAQETEADGFRRAAIKKAEGEKEAQILKATGEAEAFELINKTFKGPAQFLKQLEVTEASLKNNTKIVITEKGISPTLILGDISPKEPDLIAPTIFAQTRYAKRK